MKLCKVILSAIAGVVLLSGCISSHERVVEKEKTTQPVRERVIEKPADTTINVR